MKSLAFSDMTLIKAAKHSDTDPRDDSHHI